MPDVTIVGGGPAGTHTARLLAASGRDVTVLEEHHVSGIPSHCAGLVTREVLNSFGRRTEPVGTISAADVVLPDGSIIPTSKSIPYAYVINREDLDARLAEAAEDAGATIRYGVCYKSHTLQSDGITVKTNAGEIKSDILVGADGQNSLLAASLGDNHARSYIRGFQVDLKYRSEDETKMILRLGNEVAPGFFAWQLPLGDVTRIGLGVNVQAGPPAEYLERLLKNLGLENKERLATYSGKIPLGGRRTSYSDRIMLIGDAAGQVKPVSGGGLFPITKVAPLLKETVDRAYSMNQFNATIMGLYERAWKREIGDSLKGGMRLRKYYDRLSDEDYCTIGHMFSRPDIAELLSTINLDDPYDVVKPILKKKGVKSQLFKIYLRTFL